MDIIEILTDLIDEDTDQPRYQFNEESLQELMNSIEELGLLSPIKVRTTGDGRYKIIYGNRRYKACKTLGRRTIPCIVSTVTDEVEIYLEQIAENLTREGFSPIEEAEAFDKLLHNPAFNSSTKFLAGKLGKPEAYIKNKCELLRFGNAVKKLIVHGTEIRKDALTEDQLLPLKDLAMEHRDSLALIVARDAMPVTDVKRIAKLFKDPGISEGTKSKLLYKTGYELLETWSVYDHNRKEREKAAKEKEAAKKRAAEQRDDDDGTDEDEENAGTGGKREASAAGTAGLSATAGDARMSGAVDGARANGMAAVADGLRTTGTAAANGAASAATAADGAKTTAAGAANAPLEPAIVTTLRQLHASLPDHRILLEVTKNSIGELSFQQEEPFRQSIDRAIDSLEKQLAEWKNVRELVKSTLYT
ncbi:ParB/RepB/Spo0J family partition protein [Cohnella faecalis]|uniref:ParB/RepB/Spo0J family partition protein n=1 Tax=Cohnella faecalis TaxID=2315694 RepID=A0A398CLJ4_9BACL|nr:ParB/RepB/Spo0J family partition protein [Cohnella faecalis]RIE03533.1 ParB/RepB/Spo0J family partition protein [Cohnella faecalis]